MQSIRDLINYTKHQYSSLWGTDVDTIVLHDAEFESLATNDICFVHGVRIIPESFLLDDYYDVEDQPDIGYFVHLLRK